VRVRASAPGKLILLGEYAVLEGAPALVLAIPRRAGVRAAARAGGGALDASLHRLSAPALGLRDLAFRLEGATAVARPPDAGAAASLCFVGAALGAAQAFLHEQGLELPPLDLATDTAEFVEQAPSGASTKLGLGSSAAITVATFGAAVRLCAPSATLDRQRLLPRLVRAHRQAQGGRGSGIDVAASCMGGLLRFELAEPADAASPMVHALAVPPGLQLIAVSTGVAASTPVMLATLAAWRAREGAAYAAHLGSLHAVAARGVAAAQAEDTSGLLAAMQAYAVGIDALGEASGAPIVSAPHRAIAAIVAALGGVYKPSGAGGGDIGVAATGETACAERIVRGLQQAGWRAWPVTVEAEGLTTQIVDEGAS
jgi:phosphomevalonate kinase